MGKKVSLRVLEGGANAPTKAKSLGSKSAKRPKKPSIDAARERLGGRITTSDVPPPGITGGLVVSVAGGPPKTFIPGVVVFASKSEVHVLLDGVRLRRVVPELVKSFGGEVPLALAKIAGDARLFAQLNEGDAVRYSADEATLLTAKVVEKCRWGALVARPDGAVIAVGFRKLWPATAGGEA